MFGQRKSNLEKIISSYINNPRDVKTQPLHGEGIWFYVYVENGDLYIENAVSHSNSSKIKNRRKLDKGNLDIILELYYERKKGGKVSQQATAVTRNQVYWYGIFADIRI